MCACVHVRAHALAQMCMSENNLWMSVLALHCVDPGNGMQVIRHGGVPTQPLFPSQDMLEESNHRHVYSRVIADR